MTDQAIDRPALDVRNYTLDYMGPSGPVRALDGIDLTIDRGQTMALVGESGSGKSSLAWSIMRYLPDNAVESGGGIYLSGYDLREAAQSQLQDWRGRRIAMVFQDPGAALNPTMTLGDQVIEVLLRHRKLSLSDARDAAREALTRTGIARPAEIMERFPHQASGGEKQRVVIATAFACNPELIIFDEPTTALDIITSRQMLDTFMRLREETGVAALYISHDLGLVSEIARDVAVIHRGRIVETGPMTRVFTSPQDPYTRRLLAAAPRPGTFIGVPAPVKPEPLLSVEHVSVQYTQTNWLDRLFGNVAPPSYGCRDISFDVRKGELLGVVGESGSGKSTIAKVLSGLQDFDGTLQYDGHEVGSRKAISKSYRRSVQMVFQHPDASLNPRQRIGEILSRPLRLYDLCPRPQVTVRVADLLRMVLLPEDHALRFPHQLSGGEKQRVAIARAFAAQPSLVICDEITASLDVSVQASVVDLLVKLQAETGTTCVFITHDLNLVRQLAHRIAVMKRGDLVDLFDTAQAGATDRHPYTRDLLDAFPVPIERAS
ncbi:ABC-transporter ATP-binding protein [Marinibacterium anthonyi]|nr:ABC-transporter ATP-binding protein [Marinibacterium anthonyi]